MTDHPTAAPDPAATIEDVRRWALRRALYLERGDKPAAARRLGVALKTVYNWLNAWELAGRPLADAPTEEPDRGQAPTLV